MNNPCYLKMLAKNTKTLREEKNLSIEELGKLTKINPIALKRIEENAYKRVQFEYVLKLAKVFNIPLQKLCE